MFIEIHINRDFVKEAKEFAERTVDSTYNRFNLSREERKFKIIIGKVGEYCIASLLDRNYIPFQENPNGEGNLDKFDFEMKGRSIDVKTCHQENHKNLLVIKEKFDNYKKHDYYIGVKLDMDRQVARVYGFATREEIALSKVTKLKYTENYTISLEDLNPIQELIAILEDIKPQ